ncbi:MAG: glycosyltransferase [Nitrospiraceae bacterium]|nr:MAG: glycosyltransferase [Nitrospiraceae bacterium]
MTKRKSILCIVPLPPPVTGAALASETVINFLKHHHDVTVVPYQRGNLVSGKFSLNQLIKSIIIGIKLKFIRKKYDSVYLVNSSSLWGNKRDIFFLLMMGKDLRRKTVLHRHGANFAKYINEASFPVRFLNKKMLGEVKNAIVLGETLSDIFDGYIQKDKIKIVNNFYSSALLIPDGRFKAKYNDINKVSILFLSNLIKEKGYKLLLDVFLSLPNDIANRAEIHFAGEIFSAKEKACFLDRLRGRTNIFYHGPVTGKKKQELLWDAHIFCLPTVYKFEGQPIALLESYVSGCIALITQNGGIKDIFVDSKNGLALDVSFNIDLPKVIERTRRELDKKLRVLIMDINKYKHIADFNRGEAMNKYTEVSYCRNVEKILIGENEVQMES